MTGFILAKKIKQTSGYDERKNRQVYTELSVSPCFVTAVKTPAHDGYTSVQFGTQTKKPRNISKVLLGQAKRAGVKTPLSFFQEVKLNEAEVNNFSPGMQLLPDKVFQLKDKVEAVGYSKGKGFQGVVKRHHFKGGPKTHGQSDRQRAPGAIGSGTTPGRIWKGKKMAGRMGNDRITIKGLQIVKLEPNSILLKGLVPGSIGSIILIKTMT